MLVNIILIVIVIITGFMLSGYNRLIKLNNTVKQKISDIDVLLNQRFDLIPNLVEIVKGYSKHESETLEEIAKLRTNNFSVSEVDSIDKKFNNILALQESYPDLKANTNFLDLQSSLRKIEEQLNEARLSYNSVVTRYNTKVETIPTNLIAKIFNFQPKEFFKLDENKKADVKMNIN